MGVWPSGLAQVVECFELHTRDIWRLIPLGLLPLLCASIFVPTRSGAIINTIDLQWVQCWGFPRDFFLWEKIGVKSRDTLWWWEIKCRISKLCTWSSPPWEMWYTSFQIKCLNLDTSKLCTWSSPPWEMWYTSFHFIIM